MELQRPIVIRLKRKKKRRYSRGLGDFGRTTRGLTRASARAARAYSEGYDAFSRASDKSARKKKDGALRDLGKNMRKAARRSLRVADRIPGDLEAIPAPRGGVRSRRRQMRVMARLNRRFGVR